ncbi:hypothetical protein C5167_023257, partial [Papaver somniferum]
TSAKFSQTLQISDLNDYIAPSQACIVSLNGTMTAKKQETSQDCLECKYGVYFIRIACLFVF